MNTTLRRQIITINHRKISINIKKANTYSSYEEALEVVLSEGLHSAYNQLKVRPKSEFEIKQKLLEKGFLEYEIDLVVKELIRQSLIDDGKFVRFFLESQKAKPYGTFILKQKLYQKGIDREIIEEELEKFFKENNLSQLAAQLVKNRFYKYENLKKQEQLEKIYRYLNGRGFRSDVIENVFILLKKEKLISN